MTRPTGSGPSRRGGSDEPTGRKSSRTRKAPALAAVLEGLRRNGSEAFLDAGTARQAHLDLYSRFTRRIRFAGVLPDPRPRDLRTVLRELSADRRFSYGVVMLWNLLDWFSPEERGKLIERLDRITTPGARLYAVVDASEASAIRPVRFTPVGIGRVSHEIVGRPRPAGPTMLPAEVEQVLAPFEVTRAFTLRLGLREYAAVKPAHGS